MNQIYLKETPTEKEAYTMLIDLLRSEGIERTYHVCRRTLLKGEAFNFGKIINTEYRYSYYISKIESEILKEDYIIHNSEKIRIQYHKRKTKTK